MTTVVIFAVKVWAVLAAGATVAVAALIGVGMVSLRSQRRRFERENAALVAEWRASGLPALEAYRAHPSNQGGAR